MRMTIAAGVMGMAALAACTGGKQRGGDAISRTKFVQANADLRSVPDTAPKGDSLRVAALKKHRVNEAELRRFVVVHGRDPEYMATVWREISDSVQKRYDRSFPLLHPTNENPNVPMDRPGPGGPPTVIGQQQPPPPTGVPPRMPQRPRPPKTPANLPRVQPPGGAPPAQPPPSPLDTLRRER
ncbi:MAG TPA: hypothetical protein VF092_02405 [Longimicrobium sp.]